MNEIKGELLRGLEFSDPKYGSVWEKVLEKLSDFKTLGTDEIDYLHVYFIEGTYVSDGNLKMATIIYENTKSILGNDFQDFEDNHQGLLAAIDIALRGVTNWDALPDFKISK